MTTTKADAPNGRGPSDVAGYLAGPLRDYFAMDALASLPPRLAELAARVEALASGGGEDGKGFRDNLVRTLPALRTFAMSLCGNPTRADDLVQETAAKAWANRARFVPGSNFTAWTFTILRNQFYTEVRKHRREVEDADGKHSGTLQIPAGQEPTVILGTVMQMISALPAVQRQALLLVGAEGFSYEEAATRMGCEVGTVKSRVSRARSLLAGRLAPEPSLAV